MARPRIEGLKYFPMDVEFDAKFRAMELHFGNDFFVWIVKFWQEAYKSKDGIVDLSGILGVLQAENSRITPGKQSEIIRDCIDIGLLQQPEPEKYTSNGIQKRINQVNSDREKSRKRKENKLSAGKPHENTRTTGEKEKEKEKEIIGIEARELAFKKTLLPFQEIHPIERLKAFYDYWTEKSQSGKKMRWEMEKTWDLKKRLARWDRNEKFKGMPLPMGITV